MKYKLDKGSHSVYWIKFHFVMCTKYRRKVLQGEIDERLKYWVREVFVHFGLELIQQETDQGCNSHIDVRLFPGGHLTQ
jgi:putative transposase